MMLAMIAFSVAIGGMIIIGSTDRIFLNIIIASLRGYILFFPFLFVFKSWALNTSYEYAFWWIYPVLSGPTSIIVTIIVIYIFKNIDKKQQKTLDERLLLAREWIAKRTQKIKNKNWKNR